MSWQALDKFHKTRLGYIVFGLGELALAYGAASWAIDSGNILLYVATIILVFGGLQNLSKLLISYFHGKRQAD